MSRIPQTRDVSVHLPLENPVLLQVQNVQTVIHMLSKILLVKIHYLISRNLKIQLTYNMGGSPGDVSEEPVT